MNTKETTLQDTTLTTPSQLLPPPPTATPPEIRTFLTTLLTSTRSLNLTDATTISSKWTRGTGRDLSIYPPHLYAQIFGYEDGWMVYKEVKTFIRTHRKKERDAKPDFAMPIVAVVVVLAGFVARRRFYETWISVPAMFVGTIGGFALLVLGMVRVMDRWETVEGRVEGELREGMGCCKE